MMTQIHNTLLFAAPCNRQIVLVKIRSTRSVLNATPERPLWGEDTKVRHPMVSSCLISLSAELVRGGRAFKLDRPAGRPFHRKQN